MNNKARKARRKLLCAVLKVNHSIDKATKATEQATRAMKKLKDVCDKHELRNNAFEK
jgi:hypothetical protein